MNASRYVLLTAARNEEDYITETIKSVVSQTVLPMEWIIVSDGSTDRTDEIIREFASRFSFIKLLRNQSATGRTFAAKARSINMAYARIIITEYAFVGILDADVSFEPSYYQAIIQRFEADPRLGIAGGILFDRVGTSYFRQSPSTEWSVSGPIQMFRRLCFEEIGGYLPVRNGVDAVAEVMARMNGWKIRTFPDLAVLHHRETGSRGTTALKRHFRSGEESYRLGYHLFFFLGTCLFRTMQKPYLIGSTAALCGYCWNWINRSPLEVPQSVVTYLKAEQMGRLRSTLSLKNLTAFLGRIGERPTPFIKK
jgi:biofilm PGA synthesis N-glycosyltransferase PgaC